MGQVHPQQLFHRSAPTRAVWLPAGGFGGTDRRSFPRRPGRRCLPARRWSSGSGVCCGGETLARRLTAEERLFLGTTHPRIRQSKSSDALWLPGDTAESASADGNPPAPRGSRHRRAEPAPSISDTRPGPPEELPAPPGHRWARLESTSAQSPAGISLSLGC